MWDESDEALIRKTLLDLDPDFKKIIGGGFYYIQMPSNASRFYMRHQRAFLEYMLPDKESKNALMLDYGTGVGTFMLYMWKHGFTNIVGVDVDTHRLDACNLMLRKFGCPFKTRFYEYDGIYDIKEKPDVIFMNDYLYAKALSFVDIVKSVHNALSSIGIWFFDLLEYEGRMIPNSRNYYTENDVFDMIKDRFHVIETLSHYEGKSKKTLYVVQKK